MLKGYIDAYRALGDPEYLEAALANARFLEKNMIQKDGRLHRSFSNGKASIDGFLDDYALLAKAFIHLYQATFDIHWLETARSVVDYALINFRNPNGETFYYTSRHAKELVVRNTELADNVIPSSNSVFAEVAYVIGQYYANEGLIDVSTSMLNHVSKEFTTDMPYYANWASLLGLITYQPYEVAIMGNQSLDKNEELQTFYLPTTLFMGGQLENLPLLKNKAVDGTMIYVCRNKTCKLPEKEVADALKQLLVRTENHL
jgi:uncharacterized protein YyaL (SSP411 family)